MIGRMESPDDDHLVIEENDDDPFAVFDEWMSPADHAGFGEL